MPHRLVWWRLQLNDRGTAGYLFSIWKNSRWINLCRGGIYNEHTTDNDSFQMEAVGMEHLFQTLWQYLCVAGHDTWYVAVFVCLPPWPSLLLPIIFHLAPFFAFLISSGPFKVYLLEHIFLIVPWEACRWGAQPASCTIFIWRAFSWEVRLARKKELQ